MIKTNDCWTGGVMDVVLKLSSVICHFCSLPSCNNMPLLRNNMPLLGNKDGLLPVQKDCCFYTEKVSLVSLKIMELVLC